MKKIFLTLSLFCSLSAFGQTHRDTALVSSITGQLVSFINLNVQLYFKPGVKAMLQRAVRQEKPILINYDDTGHLLSFQPVSITRQTVLRKYFNISPKVLNINKTTLQNIQMDLHLRSLNPPARATLKSSATPQELIELFAYVKGKACSSSSACGGTAIPCITFQYKQNGCQARAHLMRQYIEDSLHIASQKIFAFGTLRAANQEGCGGNCIQWGWHVAPLVNQTDNAGNITPMVIDPSLFDRPATVEEWKSKQQSCLTAARIDTVMVVDSKYYSWNWTGWGHHNRYFYEDDRYSLTYSFLRENCKVCRP